MRKDRNANPKHKPVAVVIGATSKWQPDGPNTLLDHGAPLDESGRQWAPAGASAARSRRSSRARASSSS